MQTLTDPAVLESILNQDWPWAGFAIGDLEPEWMQHCEWRHSANSLVLLLDRLSPRMVCHYGDGSGLASILASIREPRVWANVREEFEETFRRFYRPEGAVRMRRMYLEQPVATRGEAVQLTPSDRPEIEDLLSKGEWVFFLPECLAAGHYYGVRENGCLVAIAGTILASRRYDIAALGSVFTHPDHRGKGLAGVCCSHVLASVGRAGITRVVLNVEERKAGARGVYERLGFRTACTYLDGECVRIAAPVICSDLAGAV
jgi:GNAT superfamily N-acetyltransferase